MVSYPLMENLFQRCSFEIGILFSLETLLYIKFTRLIITQSNRAAVLCCALSRLSPGSIYFVEGEREIEFFLKLLADSDVDKVYILNSVISALPPFLCIIHLRSW